jgi:hypothetical protein
MGPDIDCERLAMGGLKTYLPEEHELTCFIMKLENALNRQI